MRWDLRANPWKTFDQCDNDTNVTKYYDAVANEGIHVAVDCGGASALDLISLLSLVTPVELPSSAG
jgi:hypothetical protein